MKEFRVQVKRRAYQTATIMVDTTSSAKARAVAEYEANKYADELKWETQIDELPVRIESKVIED